jgi:hypothetical protein
MTTRTIEQIESEYRKAIIARNKADLTLAQSQNEFDRAWAFFGAIARDREAAHQRYGVLRNEFERAVADAARL